MVKTYTAYCLIETYKQLNVEVKITFSENVTLFQ